MTPERERIGRGCKDRLHNATNPEIEVMCLRADIYEFLLDLMLDLMTARDEEDGELGWDSYDESSRHAVMLLREVAHDDGIVYASSDDMIAVQLGIWALSESQRDELNHRVETAMKDSAFLALLEGCLAHRRD